MRPLRFHRALVAFSALLVIFALSCSSRDHDGSPLCNTLAELCHPFDDAGYSPAIECHAVGHRGSDAECAAAWPACRELCRYYEPFRGYDPAWPAIVPFVLDAGPSDAAADAADAGDGLPGE